MKVALLIVSIPKSRQKTFRSFQLYFRVAFQGFVLEVRLLYSYLRSFRYQLFSFFLLVIFNLSKIFREYVARFVYLYLQKLESYPFDLH